MVVVGGGGRLRYESYARKLCKTRPGGRSESRVGGALGARGKRGLPVCALGFKETGLGKGR